MLCRNPWMVGTAPTPCGGCLHCKINKRRLWSFRMFLESQLHAQNSFVTLTYNDDFLPANYSLDKSAIRKFMDKLRKQLYPRKIRYFGVGEYGDNSQRPHYHLILFGADHNDTAAVEAAWRVRKDGCYQSQGFVQVAEFNEHTAQYVCGYTIKKLDDPGDPRLLPGQIPEFARMSNRPGIGRDALFQIAEALRSPVGQRELQRLGDVPKALKFGGKSMPLGRYLVSKLREELEFSEEEREASIRRWQEEAAGKMLVLLEGDEADALSFSQLTSRENAAKMASNEARYSIFKQRKSL